MTPNNLPVEGRLRQIVRDDLAVRVAAAVAQRPTDYALGYLDGMLVAYAMSGVITKDEYHDFHDELERVGLSSRMPGWDRSW